VDLKRGIILMLFEPSHATHITIISTINEQAAFLSANFKAQHFLRRCSFILDIGIENQSHIVLLHVPYSDGLENYSRLLSDDERREEKNQDRERLHTFAHFLTACYDFS
jgi:hypothetical protein